MAVSTSNRQVSQAPRGTEGLQPQDLVLTIFGAHVRHPGQQVWSGGMVRILEELGSTPASARAALARLVNRDLLARTHRGRQTFYSLTRRAEALLSEGDRRIFGFGRDEVTTELWTVLWHAIPEDRRVTRSRFASRLRFLGFGAVQDATWIAARDREQEVRLLLQELDVDSYVSVMVGRMSQNVPPAALVEQAWRLDEVRQRYEAFVSEFGTADQVGAGLLPWAEAFRTRTLMLHRFRGFPFVDPELPEAIDPVRSLRKQVLTRFDEIYTALKEPADAHFWQTVQPSAR
jgi:phenylacetic acid degradation operon negative regulatory protein